MEGFSLKIISCHIENFASYESLDFIFDDKGLVLINGPTGSGKSTLMDVIPWCLFGHTAKGGTVDEILSWPGDKITKVSLVVKLHEYPTIIVRTRGPKSKDNDLYVADQGQQIRGKDMLDTQKRINEFLGLTPDLYLSGAYYHEFSQTAQFFTTTAKNRRAICEQIVDLSLAKNLQETTSLRLKEDNKELVAINNKLVPLETKFEIYANQIEEETKKLNSWTDNQAKKIIKQKLQIHQFVSDQASRLSAIDAEIESLKTIPDEYYLCEIDKLLQFAPSETEPCKECGADKHSNELQEIMHQINFLEKEQLTNQVKLNRVEDLKKQITRISQERNPFSEQITEVCSHEETIKDLESKLELTRTALAMHQANKLVLEMASADLELLADVLQAFRGALVQNTIADLEAKTNLLLSNHFDAEIKISLNIEDADKLEVSILKDGNNCSFTQLSKGQRQLLKISFGVSVMKCISNHQGVNFSQIFIDEALDGLDDTNKLKAIGMLETLSLEYDTIYIVEHSETIKAMVTNKYNVELVNGQSQIQKS